MICYVYVYDVLYVIFFLLDLGPFASKDPKFPLPGNMNIDVSMQNERFQRPENQQSLASLFLDVETNDMSKHQALVQFLHTFHRDEKKKANITKENISKELFENDKVYVVG